MLCKACQFVLQKNTSACNYRAADHIPGLAMEDPGQLDIRKLFPLHGR